MAAKVDSIKINKNDLSISVEIVFSDSEENLKLMEKIQKVPHNNFDFYSVMFRSSPNIIIRTTIFTIDNTREESEKIYNDIKDIVHNPNYRFLLSNSTNVNKFFCELFLKFLDLDQE